MHIARLLTIGVTLLALVIVFLMLRSGRLREKYALLWLVVGIGTLVLALFPVLLRDIAQLAGVEIPAHLIFAVAVVLLGGVAIHSSWELSQLEGETRTLAEESALLRAETVELRARLDRLEGVRPGDSRQAPRADAGAAEIEPAPAERRRRGDEPLGDPA